MKIALGLIGIFLGMLILLQSCAVAAGSGLLNDEATTGSGLAGMLVGILFFFAGAFAFALPLVSTVIFAVAGLLALLASTQGTFSDIIIWAFVSLALAVVAFFTWRSSRKKRLLAARPVHPAGF